MVLFLSQSPGTRVISLVRGALLGVLVFDHWHNGIWQVGTGSRHSVGGAASRALRNAAHIPVFRPSLPVREHGRHPEVSPSFQVIGDSGVVLVGVWCFSEPVERQQCGSLL